MPNNPRYERINLMSAVTVTDKGIQRQQLDVFSQKYYTLLNNITTSKPYPNQVTNPITTISQEVYGTTSLWWFIAKYNGSINPLDIDTSTPLKIPNKEDLDSIMSNVPTNRQGQVVTI